MNKMQQQDDFGPVPEWLADKPTPAATDLERCQQLVANLRAAMLAASGILHRDGSHEIASLLADATGTDSRAIAARRALEEDAGYIVS